MTKADRAYRVFLGIAAFLLAGLFYLVIMIVISMVLDENMLVAKVSDSFDGNLILYFPKTGGQDMLFSIISLDFSKAFTDNTAWMFIMPFFLLLNGNYLLRYIRTGSLLFKKYEKVCYGIFIAVFIVLTIWRANALDFRWSELP